MVITLTMLIVLVVLAILIIFFVVNKQRNLKSSWKGEVVDKNSGTSGGVVGGTGSITNYYQLSIKTSDGETKKVNVSQGVYEKFKIGDKIVKNAGEPNPIKGN